MRTIINYTLIAILLATVFACKSSDPLAKQRAIEELDQKVLAQRYTFNANRANPTSGRSITLSSSYTLEVTPDTITAHLPYFGRAYTAPMSSSDGGIKFTSTDFEYTVSEKKKGIYTVALKINDNNNNYQISMLIGDNGSGTIHVNQRDKQSISFTGDVD